MGTTPIGGILPWPITGNWIHSNAQLDATNTRRALTFTVPKTGNIDRLVLGIAGVNNAQTIKAGIETLDSSGNPSGTQYGGSAVGTGTPAANTPLEITLGTAASATVGDAVAIVVQWNATQGDAMLMNIGQPPGVFGSGYALAYAGSWSKNATARGGAHVRYDDGVYYETELAGGYANVSATFANNSTPDEKGNRITIPETMSVCGMYCNVDFDGNGDVVLYDGSNSVLASCTVPAGVRGSNSTHIHYARFAPIELAKNDVVRVVVKPTSATAIGFRSCDFLTSAHLAAISGGTNVYATSRTDAGSWTDDNTKRWPVGLLIDGFNSGSGGGGGLPFRNAVFG